MSAGAWRVMGAVAGATLREAWSRRLVLALIVASVAFLALFGYGAHLLDARLSARAQALASDRGGGSLALARTQMILLGMYIVNFLAAFMAIFAGVGAVSGELEAGTLQLVLAKPVRRWHVLLGKALGSVTVSVGYATLLSAALLGLSRAVLGASPPQPIAAIALLDLGVLTLSALTLLGSTFLATLSNGVVMVVLYGLSWTGGVLQALGQLTNIDVLDAFGRNTRLFVPADALWKAASVYLQTPALRQETGPNPLFGVAPPAVAFVVYAVLYVVAVVAIACWVFLRRDL